MDSATGTGTGRKVFIAHPSTTKDYEPAKQFGELVKVLDLFIDFRDESKLRAVIGSVIAQSHPDDYLLIGGIAFVNVVCVTLWLALHGQVKLLTWVVDKDDKEKSCYSTMLLDMEALKKMMGVMV